MTKQEIQIVTPGDGIVTGKRITAYKNIWAMTAVKSGGAVINRGIWNDEINLYTNDDGKEIIKRKQIVEYPESSAVQEEEVYSENLQHIYLKINNHGKEPHTDILYRENKIWGKKLFRIAGLDNIEKISAPFSFELPQPVFDWHLWGILISGFPLEENYKARFLAHESYSYLPGDFRWYTIKVLGGEIIDGGKWGWLDCWKVEVDAEVRWKFWIAKEKNVAPVQQICINDLDGSELWWRPQNQKAKKTKLTIIEAPCNLGLIEPKPGKEPGVKNLPGRLKELGLYRNIMPDKVIRVEPPAYSMYYDEVTGVRNADAIVQYSKRLSEIVNKEIKNDRLPLVIGGDCSILIGCSLALKMEGNFGLFFIDGHTDFVPPHLSLTKGAAGMDLAIVTGNGYPKLANIFGKQPYIKEENALAFGNRELEKEYVRYIEDSDVCYYDIERIRKTDISKIVSDFLRKMMEKKVEGFWIHFDVDVLDDIVMPCVDSRSPGGLTYSEIKETLMLLMQSKLLRGINITILDPDLDPHCIYTKRFVEEFSEVFFNI